MTTTTAAVTVDMIAVAAIISSSDKPRRRLLASLRNITHQLGYFRCQYCAGFARIHRAVAVVVAIRGDGYDHQLADDSAVDRCIGADHVITDARLAIRGEVAGHRSRCKGGAHDRKLFLHFAH